MSSAATSVSSAAARASATERSRAAAFSLRSIRWQLISAGLCLLLGLAIIVNVELGGEAMWFWYATALHHGVKLYSDLHFVLQPLYALETDAWMRLAGVRTLPYELLAVLHVLLLTGAMLLLLRESRWPDWHKAVVLFGAFVATVQFVAYRFDDFHVLADSFYLLGMVLLLWMARAQTTARVLALAAGLGVLAGLGVGNRLTDGGVLLLAIGGALPFMTPRRRLPAFALFVGAFALTWVGIVLLTGDSLHAYWMNSVVRASGAKGGTTSVLHGPLVAFGDSMHRIWHTTKRRVFVFAVICGAGMLAQRYWKRDSGRIVLAETAAIGVLWWIPHFPGEVRLLFGIRLIDTVSTLMQPMAYALVLLVAVRALRGAFSKGNTGWDRREAVVLIPAASLVSAAVSQGNGTFNSTITMVLLLLVLPCFLLPQDDGWPRASFLTLLLAIGVVGTEIKVKNPYNWGAATAQAMFAGRTWYRHPLYGPMYIDRALLAQNTAICQTIGATDETSRAHTELLSMPFPYANYFCGVPPWQDHVQLWYDTVTAATVATVMSELATRPPQWLLYQRSWEAIVAHEHEYHHDQPIPHHFLDQEIAGKVASGEWQVVRKDVFHAGEAWYLIRTRP